MYTVSVQPSFQEVINDVLQDRLKEDQFWINFVEIEDAEDGPVKEEIVSVNKEDQNLVFGNKNGLKFNKIDDHHYKIDYQGFEFKISASTKTYKSSIKGITSFDISPNQELYIVGNIEGDLSICRTIDSNAERIIKEAHFGEITKSLFFPSGQVILTASLDLNIKIWDVASGANPRTFLSHKERITDLAMIEKGRNFISSSLDGFVKLWDCGSGINYNSFKRKGSFKDGVTSLCLDSLDLTASVSESNLENTYEFGTKGKQLLAGHVSGVVCGYDLGLRSEILTLPSLGGEVVGIWAGDNTVLSGYSDGWIAKWDMRKSSAPLEKVKTINRVSSMALSKEKVLISSEFDSSVTAINGLDFSDTRNILSGVEETVIGLKLRSNQSFVGSGEGDIHIYVN